MPRSASTQQDAPHLRQVLGLGVAVGAQQLRGERREHRFAPADVVEVVVALERLELPDLGDHGVDLGRRRRLADGRVEDADVELAAFGERAVGLVVLGAHAAPAGVEPGGQPERVEIGRELAGIGEPGFLALQRHAGGDEGDAAGAAHQAGRLAAGVLLDLAALRVGRARRRSWRRPAPWS